MVRRLAALVLAFAAAAPAPAWARWLEARSANFIVYSDGSEAELRASVLRLEDHDRLLRVLTDTATPPSGARLKVYLVRAHKRLTEVFEAPERMAGAYIPRAGGTAALAIRSQRLGEGGEDVLRHEYAHHFMMRYHPAYYPKWYSEGFAEYLMTATFRGDHAEVGLPNISRALTLVRGAWTPIDQVLFGAPVKSQAQQFQFYAESWLLTHYLFSDDARHAQLTTYLAALQRGEEPRAAFGRAFGSSPVKLDADLQRYRDGGLGYGVVALTPRKGPIEITIRTLPDGAEDLLLPDLRLTLGLGGEKAQTVTLARVRALAAKAPQDAFAQRVLARAEIVAGDRATGAAAVERLLASSPDDADLLYLRGLAEFLAGRDDIDAQAARFAAARPWFERALAADADHYPSAFRLAQCERDAGEDAKALTHLLLAQANAPLVGDITSTAAQALAEAGRKPEAERMMAPLRASAHAAAARGAAGPQ